MISYETIGDRKATVAYIDDAMQPASPNDATMIRIEFDDGEIRYGVKAARDQLKSKFRNQKTQAVWALRAVFNEADHPRDERGRWTDSGGSDDGGPDTSSGFAFFSPNVRDDLDLNGAVQAFDSGQHKALRDASHHINKEMGQDAHEYDIVGAWKDGAENSVMDIVNKSNWETLKASAAMKGHLANQKSVLVFQDGDGDTPLYSFEAKGDVKDIHERLLQEGLAFHTLVPRAGGAQVFVADPDRVLMDNVEKAANGAEITADFGRSEFIGTDSPEGDTRSDAEQRADARRAYEEIISQSPVQGSQAVWEGTHNRWGKTEQQGDLVSRPPPGIKALNNARAAENIRDDKDTGWVATSPLKTADDVIAASLIAQRNFQEVANLAAKKLGVQFNNPGTKVHLVAKHADGLPIREANGDPVYEKDASGNPRINPKGVDRFLEKLEMKPGAPVARITDLARGGFVLDSPDKAEKILEELAKTHEIVDEGWKTQQATGYTDRAALFRDPETGLIGEIQFSNAALLKSKNQGGGHVMYQHQRDAAAKAVRAAIRGDEKEWEKQERISESWNEKMRALYGPVLDNLPDEWKMIDGRKWR